MRIKGQTVEERREARVGRECENRAALFRQRLLAAQSGRELLMHACDYVKAVAKGRLDDGGRRALAQVLVGLADERNKP